jgi:hypothetical protein
MEVKILKKIFSIFILTIFIFSSSSIAISSLDLNRCRIESFNSDNILIMVPQYFGALGHRVIDIFNDYGWNITLIGVTDHISACNGSIRYWDIPPLKMDYLISEISDVSIYDALCIMQPSKWVNYPEYGNPGGDLINSQDALNLISSANDQGITIAAWCAGVRVLAAADVISGRNVTGSSEYIEEYTDAGASYVRENTYPVVDGNIITVSGMRYIIDMCEEIALSIEDNIYFQESGFNSNEISESNNIISKQQVCLSFNNTYGGSFSDGARSIYNTADGGFIITGYTYSYGMGDSDVYLIKTDQFGNIIWDKTYGSVNSDYGNSVCQTSDGGYIITGSTCNDYMNRNKDLLLIKTDSDGNALWEKTYGGLMDDEGFSVCETFDDGFIITGYFRNESNDFKEICLIKTDSDGNSQWIKTFRKLSGTNRGNHVFQTSDSGFIISGSVGSYSNGYLIKTDEFGNLIWDKIASVNNLQFSWGISACELSDNSIIFMGHGRIGVSDILDIFIEKIDINGDLLWSTSFGESPGFDYGNMLFRTLNDNVIICGKTRNIETYTDLYVCEVDTDNGNIIWKEVTILSGVDCGNSVCISSDGGIVIAGYTDSIGSGGFDVWMTKILRVDNNIPNVPGRPSGEINGKTGREYEYTTSTTDPDGDDVFYLFDWGNEMTSFILGPYESGEECSASGIWFEEGNYEIKVKAIDEHGAESEWSDPLVVSMPKSKYNLIFNMKNYLLLFKSFLNNK